MNVKRRRKKKRKNKDHRWGKTYDMVEILHYLTIQLRLFFRLFLYYLINVKIH